MVANEEKPDLSRVLKSHTSLSRVQYALRCKRQYGCTDIAATEGKEGVCYLQGSAAVKNKVEKQTSAEKRLFQEMTQLN